MINSGKNGEIWSDGGSILFEDSLITENITL